MLSKAAIRLSQSSIQVATKRNIGLSSVIAAKVDPIQQLFVDKIREYNKKKRYFCLKEFKINFKIFLNFIC